MTQAVAVILVVVDLPDGVRVGDPATETVRDVVRSVAETVRHRIAADGVAVLDVHAALSEAPLTP